MNVQALEHEPDTAAAGAEYYQYRALSSLAVGSFVFGLLSATSILDWSLLAVPLVGILLGTFAWRQVRARRGELAGEGMAKAGLALSIVFLIGGASYQSYQYVTEVPDGFARISYDELTPDSNKLSQVIPPSAEQLNGKQVFIKGYIYPPKDMVGLREFVLCRDKGDCCFGGNPKITDRILVTLEGGLRLNYTPKLYRVAGTFRVEPGQTQALGGGVVYRLSAEYLQ